MDREIRRDPERDVGYRITNSWDKIVKTLQGAPVSTDTELGRHMTTFKTRVRQDMDEIYTRLDDEQSQSSYWLVMSLRTTVLGQMSEIRKLHAADRRRKDVTSEMLKADHRRSAEMERTGDHTTGTGDSTTGTGYRTIGTAGTRWRSCTARAAREGW
ncbi:hypothetical protein Tco_1567524 [Tanacetum coccineum]